MLSNSRKIRRAWRRRCGGLVQAALVGALLGAAEAGASPADSTSTGSEKPEATSDPRSAPRPTSHRRAVELDLIQPFIPTVNIIRPKFTWTMWGRSGGMRGDLVTGLYIRPHIPHDILETIDEYMVTAGYRQYFWRGLHAEALLSGGVAWGTNQFDGLDYTTATLFMDVNAGYRFGFHEPGGFAYRGHERVGYFVAVQGGVIFSLGVADIGPRNGKPDWFPQGMLLVGLSF